MISQKFPAGLVDSGIEFFVNEDTLFALYEGRKVDFFELPESVIDLLRSELYSRPKAVEALVEWGYENPDEMLVQFVKCVFGGFDYMADISDFTIGHSEYWDCGVRGNCPFEGRICQSLKVSDTQHLTNKEFLVMLQITKDQKDIVSAFNLDMSVNTLLKHKSSIYIKLKVNSVSGVAKFASTRNLL